MRVIGTDEESPGLGGHSHHFSDNHQHNLKIAFNKEHQRPFKSAPPAKCLKDMLNVLMMVWQTMMN